MNVLPPLTVHVVYRFAVGGRENGVGSLIKGCERGLRFGIERMVEGYDRVCGGLLGTHRSVQSARARS